jgi:acyl-coenzyme A thioesterase PaaI-like protein
VTDGTQADESIRAWNHPDAGRLLGRGHTAGDFLEAYAWDLLDEESGFLRVSCHLPDHVKNPRGQLFGGFTPTYIDLISLLTVRAGRREEWATGGERWLATTNMRVDYFEPVVGPRFVIESRLEKEQGRTEFVAARFFQDGALAVHALTTMRVVVPGSTPLADGPVAG